MKNKNRTSAPSSKETIIVLTASLAFLLFQWLVVGLIPGQLIMVGLFNLLYFAHPLTRKLAITLIPFVLFEISYDWMRLYPNYKVNPIDIQGIYETEKSLFGISTAEGVMIPCEYFNLHHSIIADFFAGIFYLFWVPGPIAFALWLFFKGEYAMCKRFTWAFLFVNIIGYIGYYIHPTAPPWYAINYGFEPDFTTPGNVAGLGRFDDLIGIPIFRSIYVNNSNIFAAIPSLHAAYMLTTTIYAIISRQPKWLIGLSTIITIGIWWTAVYTCHHYVIDVLLGILTAFIGVGIFEGSLMLQKRLIPLLLLFVGALPSQAQIEIRTEVQASVASGDHTPLWLNANKYGLSSLKTNNGYLRAGAFHSMEADSARRWAIGYGADVAIASGYTSTLVVQQAYADVRWLKGLLTVGSKEQPMELKNQELSSGSQTLGINARPVPSVRLALPDYWTVPYTRGWLGLKGHIAYGMTTDDNWQKEFVEEPGKRTEHAKLHTKAGYLRIGKEGKPVSVELGLEMACQYGGTTYTINPYPDVPNTQEYVGIKNQDGIKGMFKALIPSGGETGEGTYENTSGNQLGSYVARVNMDFEDWYLGIYADHFFEDHSQMFFLDYDGYGQGEEFNVKKDSRWLIYDLKDIMLGVELKLKKNPWLNDIVVEYLYTKYQSGPIYHDRTRHLSDHIAGRDEYYNNYMQTGWQHWGQVMGNPLYRSPLYNSTPEIRVLNNRFWAWHFGLSGNPLDRLHYRVLATWQRGWGSYDRPLPDPERNMSLLAEAEYRFDGQHKLAGWSIKGAFGLDHGALLGNNTGGQLTICKRFNIKRK